MKKTNSLKTQTALYSFILLVLLMFSVGTVMAQSNTQQEETGQESLQQDTQHSFKEETLEKFAAAVTKLGPVRNEFAQQLRGVQDQDKAIEIQKEMHQKMVAVVVNQGIDVETYNSIADRVRVDDQLKQTVEEMIKNLGG